jgi:hypothetical protein
LHFLDVFQTLNAFLDCFEVCLLGGIKDMKDLPDALFIIDPRKERIAVAEAHKLNALILFSIEQLLFSEVLQMYRFLAFSRCLSDA